MVFHWFQVIRFYNSKIDVLFYRAKKYLRDVGHTIHAFKVIIIAATNRPNRYNIKKKLPG